MSYLDGLLSLAALPLDDESAERLRAALGESPAELAALRDAARGEEPQVVFDPRWD